jgi:hypothetical protein
VIDADVAASLAAAQGDVNPVVAKDITTVR